MSDNEGHRTNNDVVDWCRTGRSENITVYSRPIHGLLTSLCWPLQLVIPVNFDLNVRWIVISDELILLRPPTTIGNSCKFIVYTVYSQVNIYIALYKALRYCMLFLESYSFTCYLYSPAAEHRRPAVAGRRIIAPIHGGMTRLSWPGCWFIPR